MKCEARSNKLGTLLSVFRIEGVNNSPDMKTNSITEALQYITDDQSSSFDAAPAFAELDTLLNSHAALVGALEGLLGLRCIKAVETIGEADANKASEAVKTARAALALAGKVEVAP